MATGSYLKFKLSCEIFEFEDFERKETQIVIHYFLNEGPPEENNIQEEDFKEKIYINRTELNKQFFQMNFFKELEFMEVQKIQMYMREQNPQNEAVDVPLITNQ